MEELTLNDLEEDQQEILDKTDISNLANYCKELKDYEDQIEFLEKEVKKLKQQADKISSEVIPNLLAEQGLSSLKLADGSSIDIRSHTTAPSKKIRWS